KDSVVEDSIGKSDYPPPKGDSTPKFIKPSLDEVISYCKGRNNGVDAQRWYDFYESKGWMVGKNKMKDWRAAIRTWERNDNQSKPSQRTGNYRGSAKPDMPVVNDTGPKREITPEERERMLARAK